MGEAFKGTNLGMVGHPCEGGPAAVGGNAMERSAGQIWQQTGSGPSAMDAERKPRSPLAVKP